MLNELKEFTTLYKKNIILNEEISCLKEEKRKLNKKLKDDIELTNKVNLVLDYKIKRYESHENTVKNQENKLKKRGFHIVALNILLVVAFVLNIPFISLFTLVSVNLLLSGLNYYVYLKNTKDERTYLNMNDKELLKEEKFKNEQELEKNFLVKKSIQRKIKSYNKQINFKEKKLKKLNSKLNNITGSLVNDSLKIGVHEIMNEESKKLVIRL